VAGITNRRREVRPEGPPRDHTSRRRFLGLLVGAGGVLAASLSQACSSAPSAPTASTATSAPAQAAPSTVAPSTAVPAAPAQLPAPAGPASAQPTAESKPAAQPKRGGVLQSALPADPPTLDPHFGFPNAFSALMYDRLVIFDSTNKPRPAIAESWEVKDDGATFIFKLRPGVKFHNGREVVADDVAYSIARVQQPTSVFAGDYAAIKSTEVLDQRTVKIGYGKPFPGVFKMLAQFTGGEIVAREAVEQHGDLARTAMGTGPFMLDHWTPGNEIVLKRNPDYYKPGLPYLDAINFKIIKDEAGMVAGLRSGAIQHMPISDYSNARALETEPTATVYKTARVQSAVVAMYVNARVAPLSDPKVREAIYWAFDREAGLKIATAGLGLPTGPISPTVSDWTLPEAEVKASWRRDVERARRAVEEAKAGGRYPDGIRTEVWADAAFRWRADTAQLLAASCKEVGIECEVKMMEPGILTKRFLDRETPIYPNSWGGSALDPDAMYRFLHSKAQDYLFLNDPEIDRLLEEGRYTWDPARRKAVYDKVQRALLERHAAIWMYHIDYFDAARKNVRFTRDLYPPMFLRGLEESWIE
jgi:peptide/nickel transport system substrate-binding protein